MDDHTWLTVSASRPRSCTAPRKHAADAARPAAVGIGRSQSAGGESSPHAQKFRVVTATLLGMAVGAVAIAGVILTRGKTMGPATPWSSRAPADNGTVGAGEIAAHIAPFYRVSMVDQLDVVTVVNLSKSSASATTTAAASGLRVALRANPSSSQVSLLNGDTTAYNLCGIGSSNCAIGVGQPTADRLLLLRREALELALYTFRYISGVQNVVAILPPGHTQQTSTLTAKPPSATATSTVKPVNVALLFVRAELQPALTQPSAPRSRSRSRRRSLSFPPGNRPPRPASSIRSPPAACSQSSSSLPRTGAI